MITLIMICLICQLVIKCRNAAKKMGMIKEIGKLSGRHVKIRTDPTMGVKEKAFSSFLSASHY